MSVPDEVGLGSAGAGSAGTPSCEFDSFTVILSRAEPDSEPDSESDSEPDSSDSGIADGMGALDSVGVTASLVTERAFVSSKPNPSTGNAF